MKDALCCHTLKLHETFLVHVDARVIYVSYCKFMYLLKNCLALERP